MDVDYKMIEKKIDEWLPMKLNKEIPRYAYIFCCNCAYIDLLVESGILMSTAEELERNLLFSLNYNIHLAYRYLKEEDVFEYLVKDEWYEYAYEMLVHGFKYAMLCDSFPKLYSGKAQIELENGKAVIREKDFPRATDMRAKYYFLRKPLSYILKYGSQVSINEEETDRQMILFKLYKGYWGEQILNQDYEPYTAMEGGGIRDCLMIMASKRYFQLHDANFYVRGLRWTQLLMCFSKEGVKKLRTFIPTENDEYYSMALEDCIYKPIGKDDYPKANIADAPLIRTKDGCIFANPFVMLFNNSIDTQFLNYLRRNDNVRFRTIKGKIKERCIPIVEELARERIKGVFCKSNFKLPIPMTKNERELDLLLVDNGGTALYIEFKHFFIPESASESKNLDEELSEALTKMEDQVYAISEGKSRIKERDKLEYEIQKVKGILVSYYYTGSDVGYSEKYPLVNMVTLYNAIRKANTVDGIFEYCCEAEERYKNFPVVKYTKQIDYAGYQFVIERNILEPACVAKLDRLIQEKIWSMMRKPDGICAVAYDSIDFTDVIGMDGNTNQHHSNV